MNQIERDAAKEVFGFVIDAGGLQFMSRINWMMAIAQYSENFSDRHGIEAMLDYIAWARARNTTDSAILATICHDIGGRNDELIQPRTIGYLGVNK